MKKLNKNNNLSNNKLLERGGLMIEALAMLGLIAVVTPTMYKKSAERTLEVEDINTATTVRTYMNAVEAYMANEYGTFMADPDGSPVTAHTGKKGHFYEDPNNPATFGSRDGTANAYYVNNDELANYLPYGFDVNRALFDYNAPKTRIVKNGNNLTAFVSFPAKNGQADGIGQERTARIASLVGSTGGYKPNSNTARGIGGIWSLTQGEGEGGSTQLSDLGFAGDNVYSLVTASANVAMDVNGGQMDNDKYLQRTREDDTAAGSGDELWRNTMRTDLYLGGHVGNETQTVNENENTQRHSIRNIQSLIVGADEAEGVAGVDDEGNPTSSESTRYGLYINADGTGSDYAKAFIKGSLSALDKQFHMTDPSDGGAGINGVSNMAALGFGKSRDYPGEYNTEIDENGDMYSYGKSAFLFNNMMNPTSDPIVPSTMSEVWIGGPYAFDMIWDDTNMTMDYYMGNVLSVSQKHTSRWSPGLEPENSFFHIFTDYSGTPNGYNKYYNEAGNEVDTPSISYGVEPLFPVNIGANTKVEGVLAARVLDTQKLRAATLSVGSENIDDTEKWLNVNQYGTIIQTPSQYRDAMGHSILTLVNPSQGGSDGIYLRIPDGTTFGYSTDRYTTFYADSDGLYYDQTDTDQEGLFEVMLDGESSSYSNLQAGEINLTARNGTQSSGEREKGTISLRADKGWLYEDENETPSEITMKNSEMIMQMKGNDLIIKQTPGGTGTRRAKHINDADHDHTTRDDGDFRTIFQGGHIDAVGANLKVTDSSRNSVFSVRGNDDAEALTGDGYSHTINDADVWGGDYYIAGHGNTIFTGSANEKNKDGTTSDRSENVYLSIGTYSDNAAVSIVPYPEGDNGAHKKVFLVDAGLAADDIDPTHYDYNSTTNEYTIGSWLTGNTYTIDPGTVYIRKGRIELIPEVGASPHSALNGSGSVAAERFVANNRDANGDRIEVPQMVNSDFVEDNYEGSDYNRYDTYMVNPAYTSVMHDIKLTTRGGARLSDILPDFINKGIYIASNTVKENANNRKMEFKLTSSGVEGFTEDDGVAAGAYDYVSPYMGVVPAPQCPPGYGRVITLNPVSFEMANAGTPRLQKLDRLSSDTYDKYTYYATLEDAMPEAMKDGDTSKLLTYVDSSNRPKEDDSGTHVMHENHELMPHQLDIKTALLEEGADKSDGSAADGINDRAWKNQLDIRHEDAYEGNKRIKLDDDTSATDFVITNYQNLATNMRVTTPATLTSGASNFDKPYLLGYTTDDINNVFRPLTFQQSTFLKSAAVPLVMDRKKKFGDTAGSGEYTSGWAVLMGFIYPYDNYKTVIDHLGVDQFSSFATGFYWNIFPVLRDRLEAYATVYCYFDRNNLYGQNVETGDGVQHIDPYDYLDALPTSFRKQSHGDYIQRLNDPALNYYEEW